MIINILLRCYLGEKQKPLQNDKIIGLYDLPKKKRKKKGGRKTQIRMIE